MNNSFDTWPDSFTEAQMYYVGYLADHVSCETNLENGKQTAVLYPFPELRDHFVYSMLPAMLQHSGAEPRGIEVKEGEITMDDKGVLRMDAALLVKILQANGLCANKRFMADFKDVPETVTHIGEAHPRGPSPFAQRG